MVLYQVWHDRQSVPVTSSDSFFPEHNHAQLRFEVLAFYHNFFFVSDTAYQRDELRMYHWRNSSFGIHGSL